MPKIFNQKGVAHLFLIVLLLAGLGVGVYVVQNRTNLLPKASKKTVQKPETSFTLEAKQAINSEVITNITKGMGLSSDSVDSSNAELTDSLFQIDEKSGGAEAGGSAASRQGTSSSAYFPGQQFIVDLWVRSDIDYTNFFAAKINFPTNLLEVVALKTAEKPYSNCKPRPACLDADPPCKMPETPDMCPPKPSGIPSAYPVQTVEPSLTSYPKSTPEEICAQVITRACSPIEPECRNWNPPCARPANQECKDFPTPCDVPPGWTVEDSGGGVPTPGGNFFITYWKQNAFDNKTGVISLIGHLDGKGLKTGLKDSSSKMVRILFKVKKQTGKGQIALSSESEIRRSSDNVNILSVKRNANITILKPKFKPSSTPTASVCTGAVPKCLPGETFIYGDPKDPDGCPIYKCVRQ